MTNRLRSAVRKTGVDLRRWPPDWRHMQHDRQRLLTKLGVQTVLDVGANEGQYAQELRGWGYAGRILSFEPLAEPFHVLSQNVGGDPLWDVHRAALGAAAGTVTMNIAGNGGASSSVLPMMPLHDAAAPEAVYVGVEEVPVRTLDSYRGEAWEAGAALHVKIDVQGFERAVIDGAAATLQDARLLEMELSFVPLYEGGMLFDEAIRTAKAHGFGLARIHPGWRDTRTELIMQADGLFVRE